MELSEFKIKKNSYIFSKESFSYISVQAQKIKKIFPEKISYTRIFSQKKAVLVF